MASVNLTELVAYSDWLKLYQPPNFLGEAYPKQPGSAARTRPPRPRCWGTYQRFAGGSI